MSDGVRMYFNPACSKCREALALLRARGVEPSVVPYLSATLRVEELEALIAMVGGSPLSVVRQGDEAFAASGLGVHSSAREVAEAVVATPRLLERPIVVRGLRAVVARPPERLLGLFDDYTP